MRSENSRLANMRGIYKLNFTGTDKVYIGQSENIDRRFTDHIYKMKNGKASKKLMEAYTLFGPPISYDVLCEIPVGSMDKDENDAIIIFDSVINGFNTFRTEGGTIRSQSGLSHYNSKYSKRVILKVFSLLYRTTISYAGIAIRTNTNKYLIANIAAGAHIWLKDEYPAQYSQMQLAKLARAKLNIKSLHNTTGSSPVLRSPTGDLHEVHNISDLCRNHQDLAKNLVSSRSNIAKVIKGSKKSHLGWVLVK